MAEPNNERQQSSLRTARTNSFPSIPTPEEIQCRYYGISGHPQFIARSSCDPWFGRETDLVDYPRMELLPSEQSHPLGEAWRRGLDMEVHHHLVQKSVAYVCVDALRMRRVGQDIAPLIIWLGVPPGSLSAVQGIALALGLRGLITRKEIYDVHVEIRESTIAPLAKMLRPTTDDIISFTMRPLARHREAISTSLGLPICAEETPQKCGTATLFFTTPSRPHKLYLLTARHTLFDCDADNGHYAYPDSKGNAPMRKVLLLGPVLISKHIEEVDVEIERLHMRNTELKAILEVKDRSGKGEEATWLRRMLEENEYQVQKYQNFRVELQNWTKPTDCIIGHVVLSPPLVLGFGDDRYTQDFAVVEVYTNNAIVDATNFIGNVIDLRNTLPLWVESSRLRSLIQPNAPNHPSFVSPHDYLLRFQGDPLPDHARDPRHDNRNPDSPQEPTTMVIKQGHGSGLTVGCLNGIHSIVRRPLNNKLEEPSREIAVLNGDKDFGDFSIEGDSGAAVVDGLGQVAGMITGGGKEAGGVTYATPMSFILRRLADHGFTSPCINPVPDDVFT